MYSTIGSDKPASPSGLKRLARRDLPTTPRVPPSRPRETESAPVARATTFTFPAISIDLLIAWLLSGFKWIVILALLGAAAGYGYAQFSKPRFTATTDLIIDPASLQVMGNDVFQSAYDQNAQLLGVESKLRVLTSGNVLRRVVVNLDLANDPEFNGRGDGLDLSFLGLAGERTTGDPVLTAIGALEKKISAWREERSFVVTLAASSQDPVKAALIADAAVSAFQTELAQAEADSASRAVTALTVRLSELKGGVAEAEDAVAVFRRDNGLEASNGELVSTTSLTLLNQQASEAQRTLTTAQALYDQLTDPTTGRANVDAVSTATMVALRTQYGLLKQDADAAATRFGPLHPTRAAAERQLTGLQQQINAEAARAVQSAKLDLDQARNAVALIETQTRNARSTVATDGQAQIQLRELERTAKARSDVYEATLARAQEIAERQQLDTTNIRLITPATPPGTRSWPPKTMVVAGAGGFGGAALAIVLILGLGLLAEFKRQRK
ncbi:MAG: lipopolysaccharide biosynthesis protein [Hyphomicrobiales bacterium]|nr:MAG: lipopolysaccharide biosynthesis protein [Hyphomicrobiales bacterium]